MARIIRRKFGELVSDGGVIDLFQTEISGDPTDIVKLRPWACGLNGHEWVMNVAVFGLAHSWNHAFQSWMRRLRQEGRRPKIPPAAEDPSAFWRVYFGEAGSQAHLTHGGESDKDKRWNKIKEFLISRDWPPEQLGYFGRWLKMSGVPVECAPEIIKEFLED